MKRLQAGSEVEAYCTRCKMDLDHRIVAMAGERIARVECLTCHGQHNYRRPASAEPPAAARRKRTAAASRAESKRRLSPAAQHRERWEQAIMGKSPDEFMSYSISAVLEPGQLVRHKKFGDGVVAELVEGGKAEVLFADGAKTLVYGR